MELSVKELRARCVAQGVSIDGVIEKADLVEALKNAAKDDPIAENVNEQDDDDDEEAMLAQALLMSQESEDGLHALPVRELRRRAEARGVDTRGVTEKADLVAALLG